MEVISGESFEGFHTETNKNRQKISRQTLESLYGVVGSNKDTRVWLSIMASTDILTETQEQTKAIGEQAVYMDSNLNDYGILVEQIVVQSSGAV